MYMKHSKIVSGLVSVALAAASLCALGACTQTEPTPTPAPTPTPEQTTQALEAPPREEYRDLSFETVPIYQSNDARSCTVQAEGEGGACEIALDFSQMDGRYVISPTKINFSCHDVASCQRCGYVDQDGGAYLISSEGLDQGGVTVTLATPILASTVRGMQLTFKTTGDAPNSEMRILHATQTNNAAFLNKCGSMGGASQEYVTVDLGVKDFAEMADSDGYIRSFQMYFRNKNRVDCYVKSITFSIGAEQLLCVDEVAENCFFREGALQAVANAVKARFEQAGLGATITVSSKKYIKNSSEEAGRLRYDATALLTDGTKLSVSYELDIPPICGAWLDATDGQYGSAHDSMGQWQQTFDPCGMLFLTDNQISCDEGIARMEYAVIDADAAFDGADVTWLVPQIARLEGERLSCLFVNASLDMHRTLQEGKAYRLLVRGVSVNGNYVLHTDIPFTYACLSARARDALVEAYAKVEQAKLSCRASAQDKQSELHAQLTTLIDNPDIHVNVEVLGEGVHSMRLSVSLRYLPEITEPRLPEYVLEGKRMTDVYNFDGESFTVSDVTLRYGQEEGRIALTEPYDGNEHVILASPWIYAHAKAPLSQVESVTYGYVRDEYCTPPAVRLCWTDANAANGKTYTVRISQSPDMSDAVELTVSEQYAEAYNLMVGTRYYWQVCSGSEASLIHSFVTEDGYPRFIKMDGVSNVRDIGGYVTLDGKRVKQGLAFRSAHLDSITEQGLAVARDQLGIRTDLDLRGGFSRPLGDSVAHVSVAMQWYEHVFEEEHREDVRAAISVFAYEENYPIVFHCSMGRDRTGTTAYLILGLLGVDEDTLYHEYYASYFSAQGAFDTEEFPLMVKNIQRLRRELDKYGEADDALSAKIEAFLLDVGVSAEEIQSIRENFLEQ